MAVAHGHLPLCYHRHLGMAYLNVQKACSDLARLYRIVLASAAIQQGSGHRASWKISMVNTKNDTGLKPRK